jgi:hydroxymethylpyrimidine pyrophosphatase-like HAD family hydrolase
MDGTLVPFGRNHVSQRAVEAIHELRRAGIQFGPASGREPVDLLRLFSGDATCFATGIMANGKMVDVDGRRIKTVHLENSALRRLEDYAFEDPDCLLMVYVPRTDREGNASTDVVFTGIEAGEVDEYCERAGVPLSGVTAGKVPDVRITSAGFMCLDLDRFDTVRSQIEVLCPELDFARPAPTFLDVLPHGWTKASALPLLEEELDIGRDEIAFFGDSENDVAMLKAVPNSFAVSSGSSVAQEAARHRIGDASEDSVAAVFEAIARTGGEIRVPEEAQA